MDIRRNDELFCAAAAEHRSITSLMDGFFGFLKRNTDFYMVEDDPQGVAGFPSGTAERLLMNAFRKHSFVPLADSTKRAARTARANAADSTKAATVVGKKARSKDRATKTSARTSESDLKALQATVKYSESSKQNSDDNTSPKLQTPIRNGGVCDRYWWSQSLDALVVCVPLRFAFPFNNNPQQNIHTPLTLKYFLLFLM